MNEMEKGIIKKKYAAVKLKLQQFYKDCVPKMEFEEFSRLARTHDEELFTEYEELRNNLNYLVGSHQDLCAALSRYDVVLSRLILKVSINKRF